MKLINKVIVSIIVCIALIGTQEVFAQRGKDGFRGNGKHQRRNNAVVRHRPAKRVIVRSKYRPVKMAVYHPYWGLKRNFNRRWIYFPLYNIYWDNWRQMYVFRNGAVWTVNTNPPVTLVNINIDNEKHYELNETDDDFDEIYQNNENHQSMYKLE